MGVLLENQWLEAVRVVNAAAKRAGLGEKNSKGIKRMRGDGEMDGKWMGEP